MTALHVLRSVVVLFAIGVVLAPGNAHAGLLRISAQGGCTDISGSNGWVPTGIMVPAAGTPLSLGVEGTISVGGPNIVPAGSGPAPAGGGFCAPNLAPHSAIGCIGGACTSGSANIFAIGVGGPDVPGTPAPAAGMLFLGVNDDFYVDNTGDWNAAVGLSPNIVQAYVIVGISDGIGWSWEMTDPGQTPRGWFNRNNPGLAPGVGPPAFAAAFGADIASLGLPNVGAVAGPGGMLAINAPAAFDLWITAPGAGGLPTQNINGPGGPFAFNPTIEATTTPAAASVPVLPTWALLFFVLVMILAGSMLLIRKSV